MTGSVEKQNKSPASNELNEANNELKRAFIVWKIMKSVKSEFNVIFRPDTLFDRAIRDVASLVLEKYDALSLIWR